jgi:hypothetical protein
MPVEEAKQIEAALSLESLTLPPKPRVVDVKWDWYEDSEGETGLDIWVLLDDETTDREIETAPIHAIKDAIIESLERHRVAYFPYFSFARRQEYVSDHEAG